jgi:thimet oligopeptidase
MTIHPMNYINNLFPKNIESVKESYVTHETFFKYKLQKIYNIPVAEQNYENVVKQLDDIGYDMQKIRQTYELITLVHPDKELRDVCEEYQLKIANLLIEHITTNSQIYQLYKNVEINIDIDTLTEQKRYYFVQSLIDMTNEGLHLPQNKLNVIKILKTKITEIGTLFDKNIQELQGSCIVSATKDEVIGLKDEFLKSKYNADTDQYQFGVDYPTYVHVIENCDNEKIRKELYYNFNKIAHPENQDVITDLIKARHSLATELGYDTYPDYELSSQMVKTGTRVNDFYDSINPKFQIKSDEELRTLKDYFNLKELHPWNVSYYINKYTKDKTGVDENVLKKYFPVEATFNRVLNIYTQFFGLKFEEIPKEEIKLWHNSIRIVKVTYLDTIIGNIVCDLYPRKNKYGHACCCPINVNTDSGEDNPALAVVIANFPKKYFRHGDVVTFFHEFGHAIHQLLGTSEMKTNAGCHTVTDFVECPSQLLEEWMWEPEILNQIALNDNGDPIPEDMLLAKIKHRHQFGGLFHIRQSMLGQVALSYYRYNMTNPEDRCKLWKNLTEKYQSELVYDESIDISTRFGHLYGYGCRYYGYLWSKVIAIEIFNVIKNNNGLLNPMWGKKYIDCIIGRGGSMDELEMVETFLGHTINFNGLDNYMNN